MIYDSYGNTVNKAKNIDYSDIPTDDQLPKEPGKVKVDKSTEAIDWDYGLDLSSYKDMVNKNKSGDTDKPKRDIDYSKISSEEQLIYDSFGNVVNKPTKPDYSLVQDTDHFLGLAIDDINEYKDIKESNFDKQLRLMIQAMVLGKYNPDETTGLGTVGQMSLALTGADAAADVRDLSHDFKNWEWTKQHYLQTALDGIGLLPVLGILKYVDEAAEIAKKSDEVAEAITDASKKADDLGIGKGNNLDNANFAQKTYSPSFSKEGQNKYSNLAGKPIKTVDDLTDAIKNGLINSSEIPIDYIIRDGNILILNTRSSQALIHAGIPRSKWNVVNRTGDEMYENMLTNQLKNNGLSSIGTPTIKFSGGAK